MTESYQQTRPVYRLRRIGKPATLQNVGDIFWLNKEVTVIGRNAASSDIFLDSLKNKALISRLHARITTQKDTNDKTVFKLCDTSLNGTYVNDCKVVDTIELSPGDTVTFGHTRGAVLSPGTFAQQQKSEFRFQFEEIYTNDEPSDLNAPRSATASNSVQEKSSPETPLAPVAPCLPNLSSFLTPCTPSCSTWMENLDSTVHENRRSNVTLEERNFSINGCSSKVSDSDQDNDDLLAFAIAAGDAMSESDDEIFSLEGPNTSGVTNNNNLPTPNDDPVCQRSGFTSMRIQDGKVDVKSKGTKVVSRKRRKLTRPHKNTKRRLHTSIEEVTKLNSCASVDCIHPHDKQHLVSWVQCDDCDEWYHVKCTGLTLKSVKPKTAKFHCGCV